MSTLSEERVRELLALAEKATKGPQIVHKGDELSWHRVGYAMTGDDFNTLAQFLRSEDARHYTACDPQTISSLATELLALREANAAMAGALTDQRRWMTAALDALEYKTTSGRHAPVSTGYAYAPIPDWALRQRLEAIDAALSHTPTETR